MPPPDRVGAASKGLLLALPLAILVPFAFLVAVQAGGFLAGLAAGALATAAYGTVADLIMRADISPEAGPRRAVRAEAARELLDAARAGREHAPFVLYLRPFDADKWLRVNWFEVEVRGWSRKAAAYQFDEFVANAFDGELTVVGLGYPNEGFGAAWIRTSNENWWDNFLVLATRADLVLAVAPAAESAQRAGAGFEREIVHLVMEEGLRRKLVVVAFGPEAKRDLVFFRPSPAGFGHTMRTALGELVAGAFAWHGRWDEDPVVVPIRSSGRLGAHLALALLSDALTVRRAALRFQAGADAAFDHLVNHRAIFAELPQEEDQALALAVALSREARRLGYACALARELHRRVESRLVPPLSGGPGIHPIVADAVFGAAAIAAAHLSLAGLHTPARELAERASRFRGGAAAAGGQVAVDARDARVVQVLLASRGPLDPAAIKRAIGA